MLQNLFNALSPEFAIDLGSSHAHIYVKGRGLVAKEAAYVSYEPKSGSQRKIVAIGNQAKALRGRTSSNIKTISPLAGGCIHDFDLAEKMLRQMVLESSPSTRLVNSRVVLSLPTDATELEKRSLIDAVQSACSGKVFTVTRQLAAAIGAGLQLGKSRGSMIIDIGAGSTEVAVISLNGLVASSTTKAGGNGFDNLITDYIRKKHALVIGASTAESLKLELASAILSNKHTRVKVQGRSITSGLPGFAWVTNQDIFFALKESFLFIADLVKKVLDETPPEIAADLMDTGAILIGGGALISELDSLLSEETGLPITLIEDPQTVVVEGSGKILEKWTEYKHLLQSH